MSRRPLTRSWWSEENPPGSSVSANTVFVDDVVAELDAFRSCDECGLSHHLAKELAALRHAQELVDGEARQRGQAGEGAEECVLVPQDAANVSGHVGVDAGCAALGQQPLGALALRSVELAEDDSASVPVFSTTPGSLMLARMNDAPPTTCSAPI